MINSIIRNKIYVLLFLVLFFGGLIRFYQLDKYPVSLYWDEVSIANNANFILQTGRDEHGKMLPLLFKGFNDYKSPGNVYFSIIPISLFGLNEFSARFISAFLGTMLILVMFFLGKNIAKLSGAKLNIEIFGLSAAFLLAISPWHIQFSRAGFEANSGLFLVTLAITLFLISIIKANFRYFYAASLFFALSGYFYRSVFIFAPIFLAILILINYKFFITLKNLKYTLIGIFIFAIVLIPFVGPMLSDEGMSRNNNVSIFNPENSFDRVVEISKKFEVSDRSLISKIIYNRRIIYGQVFLENYISYFSYDFLFKNGDPYHRHNVIGFGQFYLWQIPFLIIGLFSLFFIRKKVSVIILSWLLIAAIPAALSMPSSHALRSLNMLPAYLLIIASGVFIFYKIIPKKTYLLVSILLGFVIFYSFFSFVNNYKKSAQLYSRDWGDGYKQLVERLIPEKNKYEKLLITGHFWQPYSYFLFYENYDPDNYLKSGSKNGFEKYVFGGTAWEKQEEFNDINLTKLTENKKALVVLSFEEHASLSAKMKIIDKIYNQNNELIFLIGKYGK